MSESNLDLKANPTLPDYQEYVAELVRERGFNDDVLPLFLHLFEECGEFAKAAREVTGGKFAEDTSKANLQDEAADVFIVMLGLCNVLNIDLEQAFRDKEAKNKLRVWQ